MLKKHVVTYKPQCFLEKKWLTNLVVILIPFFLGLKKFYAFSKILVNSTPDLIHLSHFRYF